MTLVNAETGEVVGTSLAVAAEPSSLVAVHDQCSAIEAWAESCDSVAELHDAKNKLAAIDEYLSRTSTEGRGRVAETMRRLEVRIGKLLGPAQQGGDRRSDQVRRDEPDLSKQERHAFRRMAENEDVVERVLADSSDEEPASRRKVIDAIKERDVEPRPKSKSRGHRSPLTDTARRAAWEFRKAVERVEKVVADDRYLANKDQVAAQLRGHLTYAIEVCQDLLDGFDTEPEES